MRIRPVLIASVASLGLLAASCSSGGSSSTSSAGSSAASTLITKSQTAVQTAGSVHFVDVTKIGSKSESLIGDIGPSSAQEVLSVSGSEVLSVVLVSNTIYIKTSSASVLQSALSLSATTAAASVNKWISISSTDKAYSSIAQSLTVNAALSIYYPKSSAASILPSKTVAGVTVTPVTGSSTPSTKTTEQTTVYLNQKTSLPVTASLVAKSGSTTETKQAVFTKWGDPITITAPADSVTYASLAG
ncbi:MAG: hypothetical protein WCG59_01425 [Actinomycetes bacterium]